MLILATMSPRRREILALAGFEFTVHPADIDESVPDGTPADSAVMMTAQKKAEKKRRNLISISPDLWYSKREGGERAPRFPKKRLIKTV